MVVKCIFFREEARIAMERGIDMLSDAVSTTLGPKGRNVVLGQKFSTPQIVNDGITIARAINPLDNIENMGVCLIRQAASKTNDVAGDGTTTATVIAHAIIKQGLRNIAAGSNPIVLKRGIEKAAQYIVDGIAEDAMSITGWEDIFTVATISAGNDRIMGKLIANAILGVGNDGLISVEESNSTANELEFTEGFGFERGFLSGYFVTEYEKIECLLRDPYILLTDKRLTVVKDLLLILELMTKLNNKPLLIIAEDVQEEALATLIINSLQGILKVVAVRAPGFGEKRSILLADMAVMTGGQVICSAAGYNLENMQVELLGRAQRVIIKRDSTTIITEMNKQKVLARCEQLKRELENVDSTFEKEKIQERLSKLSGGIAIIRVGAATETEMRDKKLRMEDAVNATKAALEEGIVPGGGITLARLNEDLKCWVKYFLKNDEVTGGLIVGDALCAPFKKIVANAGKNGAVTFAKLIKESDKRVGYDAASDEMVDMYDYGIIDPAKVTRATLQNATSIASMVLTTECIIVDSKNDYL